MCTVWSSPAKRITFSNCLVFCRRHEEVMPRRKPLIVFVVSCLITILAGWWVMRLLMSAEYVHFNANFPVNGKEQTLSLDQVGGPWTMLEEGEWKGYAPGGLMVWGREGEVKVDVGGQGILKRIVQPWDVTIATYWIRNVGLKPRKVRLDLDMCGMPVKWVTFEREWDPAGHRTTREIKPAKTYCMDWHIRVPEERRNQKQICRGGLKIFDADTGSQLTYLPITIENSRVDNQPGRGGD